MQMAPPQLKPDQRSFGYRVGEFALLYSFYSLALLSTYIVQLVDANLRNGWHPWAFSVEGCIGIGIYLPLIIWITARLQGEPSDLFRLFVCAIPLVSLLLLNSVVGDLPGGAILAGSALLLGPLLLLELLDRLMPAIKGLPLIKPAYIELMVVGLLLCAVLTGALHAPTSAGFGMNDSFIRRFEGRELYAPSSMRAYTLAICMNGLAPYLAFRAVLNRRWPLLALAAAVAFFFFWLIGVKAPSAYVVGACLLGYLIRKNKLNRVAAYFLYLVIALWVVVVVEWCLFDQYSYIADYVFRRLFPIQALDQGYYLKFIFSDKTIPWSWLQGALEPGFQATYYIGEHYGGNVKSNSNTNAFLYAVMAKGIGGYLAAAGFVALFLVVLNRLWASTRNPSYLFLGFLYGLLVIEQAYTVAMVSSGVGLLFVLILIEDVRVKSPDARTNMENVL